MNLKSQEAKKKGKLQKACPVNIKPTLEGSAISHMHQVGPNS